MQFFKKKENSTVLTYSEYNRYASWSAILSLLWGFGLFSLLGILFGVIGLRRLRTHPGKQKGFLRAYIGLLFGITGILFILLHLSSFAEMFALS